MERNKAAERQALFFQQAYLCWKLRDKGLSIRGIAELVGLDKMTVCRRLKLAATMPICGKPKFCNFQWRTGRNG